MKRRSRETGCPEPEIEAEIEGRQYRIDYEHLRGAPFYRMIRVGRQKRLLINTAHRFYSDVYNGPHTSARVRTALELMLLVLGECEIDSSGEGQAFYLPERVEWSRRFETLLERLDRSEPMIDPQSAEAEDVEGTRSQPNSAA